MFVFTNNQKPSIMKKILVKTKNGLPEIDGMGITFDTKEIRAEIESIHETNSEFYLPAKYSYEEVNSTWCGKMIKIILKVPSEKEKIEGPKSYTHKGALAFKKPPLTMNKFDLAHSNNEKRPMEADLLPCPFCGCKAELSGCFPNGQYYIACSGCRVSLWYDRKDKAIGMWNKRISPTLRIGASNCLHDGSHIDFGDRERICAKCGEKITD